eukprot:PLAT1696.1.p1 GENE.PLAT1696.1~~PLAT1696.1.p1  ORF type:complete len:242 (+),score=35.97 PLAT1696.1:60-785(+)
MSERSPPPPSFDGATLIQLNVGLPLLATSALFFALIFHPDTPVLLFAIPALGALHCVAFFFLCYNVRMTVEPTELCVRFSWLWGRRKHMKWPLEEVNGVQLQRTRGSKRFRLVLALADNSLVHLQALSLRGFSVLRSQRRFVEEVNTMLLHHGGRPTVAEVTSTSYASTHDKVFVAPRSDDLESGKRATATVLPMVPPASAVDSVESLEGVLPVDRAVGVRTPAVDADSAKVTEVAAPEAA